MFIAKDGFLLYYGERTNPNAAHFDTKPKVRWNFKKNCTCTFLFSKKKLFFFLWFYKWHPHLVGRVTSSRHYILNMCYCMVDVQYAMMATYVSFRVIEASINTEQNYDLCPCFFNPFSTTSLFFNSHYVTFMHCAHHIIQRFPLSFLCAGCYSSWRLQSGNYWKGSKKQ